MLQVLVSIGSRGSPNTRGIQLGLNILKFYYVKIKRLSVFNLKHKFQKKIKAEQTIWPNISFLGSFLSYVYKDKAKLYVRFCSTDPLYNKLSAS